MKKSAKIGIITLSSILALILIALAVIGIISINANAIRFDHVDKNNIIGIEFKNGNGVNYPVFGNSLALGDNGDYFSVSETGQKNLCVYSEVNGPVSAYVEYIARRECRKGLNLDYTTEQDNGTLTVNLIGSGIDENGNQVSVDKKMVFDIENASPEKLPVWVNKNEADEEFQKFWNYLINTSTEPMPDWYAEQYKDGYNISIGA